MAFVSLAAAKRHLRVPLESTEHDADISLKLDQAEGIILDYLKTRSLSILSVSVANPTVITTDVPHSLVSGTTYALSGTTTTPTVNGPQVVTVVTATTFTVPVNVTIGQSAEAGFVAAPTWTEATVPKSVQAAALLVLGHLHDHRGDDIAGTMRAPDVALWGALELLLARQRDPALA